MSVTGPTLDARAPEEIAARAVEIGVAKARRDALSQFVLGVLGGAFIAIGALFFAVVMTDSALGLGPTRLVAGLAFSVGLMLIVVAGAELFTGNNLIAVAWVSRRITTLDVLRNWTIVYVGNFAGAVVTALLAFAGGVQDLGGGHLGSVLSSIGVAKAGLDPVRAVVLGILCNALVCLAVWLTLAGRSVADKLLAVALPVAAFVALGFEHCVANMLFLPLALLLDGGANPALLPGAARNLACVTAGNAIGGTILVAGVYWLAYLRRAVRRSTAENGVGSR